MKLKKRIVCTFLTVLSICVIIVSNNVFYISLRANKSMRAIIKFRFIMSIKSMRMYVTGSLFKRAFLIGLHDKIIVDIKVISTKHNVALLVEKA